MQSSDHMFRAKTIDSKCAPARRCITNRGSTPISELLEQVHRLRNSMMKSVLDDGLGSPVPMVNIENMLSENNSGIEIWALRNHAANERTRVDSTSDIFPEICGLMEAEQIFLSEERELRESTRQVAGAIRSLRDRIIDKHYNPPEFMTENEEIGQSFMPGVEGRAVVLSSARIDYQNNTSLHNRRECFDNRRENYDCGNRSTELVIDNKNLLSHVNCIRIGVESLSFNIAGLKSILVSNQDAVLPLAHKSGQSMPPGATYFVEYDIPHNLAVAGQQTKKRQINGSQPWSAKSKRFCSNRQIGETVYFEDSAIHNVTSTSGLNQPNKLLSTIIVFSVFSRHLNQRLPSFIGKAHFQISDILHAKYLSQSQDIPIIDVNGKKKSNRSLGCLTVQVELGIHRLHFGKDLSKYVEEKLQTEKSTETLNILPTRRIDGEAQEENMSNKGSSTSFLHADPSLQNQGILLRGLLHISEGRYFDLDNLYLVCRSFWKPDVITSDISLEAKTQNFMVHEVVPLLLSTDLLKRCQNNFLVTEVWKRDEKSEDHLIGIAKLSLNQFFVSYRNPTVVSQLLLAKHPVIAVDGWVNVKEPISQAPVGCLHVVLALGTEDQIQLLDMSRGLREAIAEPNVFLHTHTKNMRSVVDAPLCAHASSSVDRQSVITSKAILDRESSSNTNDCLEKINGHEDIPSLDTQMGFCADPVNLSAIPEAIHVSQNIVCNSQLPVNCNLDVELEPVHHLLPFTDRSGTGRTVIENKTQGTQTEYDSTADKSILQNNGLLDKECHNNQTTENVQLHVMETASGLHTGAVFSSVNTRSTSTDVDEMNEIPLTLGQTSGSKTNQFQARVEIESAMHLPNNKQSASHNTDCVEPTSYVSFQAERSCPKVDSHIESSTEMVVTPLAFCNSNPMWNWHCNTRLSTKVLTNSNKRLIFKVWQAVNSLSKCPDPVHDVVLGFVVVDLTVLLYGLPWISGWFNITDFTGQCKGQIKINITPLENLSSYVGTRNIDNWQANGHTKDLEQFTSEMSHFPESFLQRSQLCGELGTICSTSVRENTLVDQIRRNDVHKSTEVVDDLILLDDPTDSSMSTCLSGALREKLSELDTITQRLKQRLEVVTSEENTSQQFHRLLLDENFANPQHVFTKTSPGYRNTCLNNANCKNSGATLPAGQYDPSQKIIEVDLDQDMGIGGSSTGANTGRRQQELNNLARLRNTSPIKASTNLIVDLASVKPSDTVHKCRYVSKDQFCSFNTESDNELKDSECSSDVRYDDENSNDFDALTDYLFESAAQEIQLENVFNPLLFQQLLMPVLRDRSIPSILNDKDSRNTASVSDSGVVHNTILQKDSFSGNQSSEIRTIPFEVRSNDTAEHGELDCVLSKSSSANIRSNVDHHISPDLLTNKQQNSEVSPPIMKAQDEMCVAVKNPSPVNRDSDTSFCSSIASECAFSNEVSETETDDTSAVVSQLSLVSRQAPDGGNPGEEKICFGQHHSADNSETISGLDRRWQENKTQLETNINSFKSSIIVPSTYQGKNAASNEISKPRNQDKLTSEQKSLMLQKDTIQRIAKIFRSNETDPRT